MVEKTRHIRKAGAHETDALSRLIRVSYRDVAQRFKLTAQNCPKHPSNCTRDWVKRDMERGVTYFCLDHDGNTIGCAALERAGAEEGYLERLAVLPKYRQKGFGNALVQHVFEAAKASGICRIGIGIISEQEELKRWYQNMGFVEQEIKRISHLPFLVSLLSYRL